MIDFPKVREIYIDPTANALWERWWHKLIFWKKYRYQSWKVKTKRISIKEIEDA